MSGERRPTNPPRWETQEPVLRETYHGSDPAVWINPQALDRDSVQPSSPLELRVNDKLVAADIGVVAIYEGFVPRGRVARGAEVKVLLAAPNTTTSLDTLTEVLLEDLGHNASEREHPLFDPEYPEEEQPVRGLNNYTFATTDYQEVPNGEDVIGIGRITLWGSQSEASAFSQLSPKLVVIMYPTLATAHQAANTLAQIEEPGGMPFAREFLPLHAFSEEELRVMLRPKDFARLFPMSYH